VKKKRPAKLFREMNLRFWLEQAEEDRNT